MFLLNNHKFYRNSNGAFSSSFLKKYDTNKNDTKTSKFDIRYNVMNFLDGFIYYLMTPAHNIFHLLRCFPFHFHNTLEITTHKKMLLKKKLIIIIYDGGIKAVSNKTY